MRRTLILLALSVAGMGGSGTAHPGAPVAGMHEIAPVDGSLSAAFLRSAAGSVAVAWQDGSGPAPRPLFRRSGALSARNAPLGRSHAHGPAFRAQCAAHRDYAARLALSRAGGTSFNTTTPPPSRVVL